MLTDNIPSDLLKIIVNYIGDEDLITFIMNHSKFNLYEINMFLDVLKKYVGEQNKCSRCGKNYHEFEYKKCRKSFKEIYVCDNCLNMFFRYVPKCDLYLDEMGLKLLNEKKCNKCGKNYYKFEYKKCRKSFKKAYICDICLDMFFYYDPICDQYLGKKKLKLLKQNLYKNKDILNRLIKPITLYKLRAVV